MLVRCRALFLAQDTRKHFNRGRLLEQTSIHDTPIKPTSVLRQGTSYFEGNLQPKKLLLHKKTNLRSVFGLNVLLGALLLLPLLVSTTVPPKVVDPEVV